jgi:hypothetical protein
MLLSLTIDCQIDDVPLFRCLQGCRCANWVHPTLRDGSAGASVAHKFRKCSTKENLLDVVACSTKRPENRLVGVTKRTMVKRTCLPTKKLRHNMEQVVVMILYCTVPMLWLRTWHHTRQCPIVREPPPFGILYTVLCCDTKYLCVGSGHGSTLANVASMSPSPLLGFGFSLSVISRLGLPTAGGGRSAGTSFASAALSVSWRCAVKGSAVLVLRLGSKLIRINCGQTLYHVQNSTG